MSYGLLWVETLIACLLWVGLLAACVMPMRSWLGGSLRIIGVAIPLLALSAFVAWSGYMRFSAHLENNWFDYMLSLWLAFVIGMVVIFRRAGAATTWPRGGLFAAFLASIALLGMTFWNIDLTFRARANILSIEAETRWIADEPALFSDSQNAAPIYERILPRLAEDDPDDLNNPPLGNNDAFDPNEPATIAFLKREAKTIALLRKAAAMPSCRFDDDLQTPNIPKMLPEFNDYRNAANVLGLDARNELARGHVTPAMADVVAIFGLSRQVGQRPLLVSGLVAIGMDVFGNYQLQEALPYIRRAEDLADLNLAALASPRRILRRSLEGEERLGLSWIGGAKMNLWTGQTTTLLHTAGMPDNVLIRSLILSNELDAYVDLMNRVQQLLDQPYFKSKSQWGELSQSNSPDQMHQGIFTSILAPSLAIVMQTAARAEAGDDCAQVAVAATRYRLDHGSLPAHLEDLIQNYLDEIPLDPFDGHPLRLAVKNDQWIVYSVGPDGVDDGGVSIEEDYPNRHKGDLIFTLKITPPATTQPN